MGALKAAFCPPVWGPAGQESRCVVARHWVCGGGEWAEISPEKFKRVLNATLRSVHYVSEGGRGH